jgi:hypothetical protein
VKDPRSRTTLKPSVLAVVLAFVLAVPALSGCSKTYIQNTDVEDNSENRKVVLFCERYRRAVEEKDIASILKMASPRYYEDGGNTNVEDDIDYAGLKDYLSQTFLKTNAIRYEIRYRKITTTERKDIYVDYSYSASYRIPGTKNEEWRHAVADNRLVLVPDGEGFRIISGM